MYGMVNNKFVRLTPEKSDDDSEVWDTKLEKIDKCPCIKKAKVLIDGKVSLYIDALMKAREYKEWLAYLIGEVIEKDDLVLYHVRKLYVPKQEAGIASVEVKDDCPPNTIGVIHSHHTMSCSFSGVDNDYINSNHPLSVLVNKTEIKAITRYFPSCGDNTRKYFEVEADIEYNFPNIDHLLKNIEEPSFGYTNVGQSSLFTLPEGVRKTDKDEWY